MFLSTSSVKLLLLKLAGNRQLSTIAYKDGVMAADTLITGNDMRCGSVTKIAKGKQGIGGSAGSIDDNKKFRDWIERGGEHPKYDGIDGLYVTHSGKMHYLGSTGEMVPFTGKFSAVGSGEKYAMAAMEMGATAKQAVEIAKKFDCHTGGRVQEVCLDTSKRKRKV